MALVVPRAGGGVPVILTPAGRKPADRVGMEIRSNDPRDLVLDVAQAPADHIPPGVPDADYWQALTTAARFTRTYWRVLDRQATVRCSAGHVVQITPRGALRLARDNVRSGEALI